MCKIYMLVIPAVSAKRHYFLVCSLAIQDPAELYIEKDTADKEPYFVYLLHTNVTQLTAVYSAPL